MSAFVAKECQTRLYQSVLELVKCCLVSGAQHSFHLNYRMTSRRNSGHAAFALASFSSYALGGWHESHRLPEVQGFLAHHAVPQPCAGKQVQHLHPWITSLRKQGRQRGLTLSLSVVLLFPLKLCIPPQWDKIHHYCSALLRLHVLVMPFATHMTGGKTQGRDAVLGLAVAATKVVKLLVHA